MYAFSGDDSPLKYRSRSCCVLGCKDRGSKRHRFPKKYREIFKVWVDNIKPKNYKLLTADEIYNMYVVCEKHFVPSDIVPGRRGLKVTAIPSLYIPESKTYQSTTSTPSINSNIGQDDFEFAVNEVHPPTAKEMLSIKQESELFCRLCFCISTDSNSYINILPSYGESSCKQDKVQEMIQKVIPDLDISLTHNPGICIDCESRLINAFEFISFSIQNQNTLLDHKNKHGDDVYVNIQDVVTTFHDAPNKRPIKEAKDVSSKKLKTTSSNDQDEIKCYATGERDITIKEELDCEPLGTTDKSNPIVIEQSCNRLLNTSANRNNNNLKHIKVNIHSMRQTTKVTTEEGNKRDEIRYVTNKVELKSIRPVEIITTNSTGLRNNVKAGNMKIKVLKINPGKELLGSSKTDHQGRAAECSSSTNFLNKMI